VRDVWGHKEESCRNDDANRAMSSLRTTIRAHTGAEVSQTAVDLRAAIAKHRAIEADYQRSRESLRGAVRLFLAEVTAERGSLLAMANRLGVSMGVMANVKSGIGAVSPEWAEKLLASAPSSSSTGTEEKQNA